MPYSHKNCPVIDDNNYQSSPYVSADGFSTGLIPRDYSTQPLGFMACAKHYGDEDLIPESEWRDRIAQQDKDESSLHHLLLDRVPVKDQNGTNYCWINAPTYCTEAIRCVMGEPYVELSPASVGGPIKNYRNVGGWGTEGLEYIANKGLVPVSMWPANGISSRYNTAEANAARSRFRVTEWDDITPRSLKHMASRLLRNIPCAVGYNWWGHEVSAIRLIWENGEYAIIIANSWSTSWGDRGYGKLKGSKMLPDDICAPRVAIL